MLPFEEIELAIYRYVDKFGPAVSTALPTLLNIVGGNVPYHSIVERLKDLKNQGRIHLFKYSGDTRVPYDRFVEIEGETNFYYGGGFVIEIAPGGRKYFEELDERDQREKQSGTVFVSCGQYTDAEKQLGKDLAVAVGQHTSCKGYFAENQNSLETLSRHIFEALDKCSGFVAVMHRRGEVRTLHAAHQRASVWIEQEVAIAAFLTQVHKKQFPIAFYIQKGVKREGVREQLRIDAIEFETEADVLAHFAEQLKSGKFKPK